MDYSDIDSGGFGAEEDGGFTAQEQKPPVLPDDLPKSLNDRRRVLTDLVPETELYDGWQGQSQFLTSPITAKPLHFDSLALDDPNYEQDLTRRMPNSDTRLLEMLAAQAQHQGTADTFEDADTVVADEKLSEDEKKAMLQKAFIMAASNGDTELIRNILGGKAKSYVDINGPDEDGTPPLLYASCFGHGAVVQALVEAGVDVDKQDSNHWNALMWAMTNRHKDIAKVLLDNGASPDAKTTSGRTAFDFVEPDSEMSFYLHDNGYAIGSAGVTDDFYNPGFTQDRFEEEMAENDFRRRMMMESARDLEVDLGNVGIDDQPEHVDDFDEEEQQEFDWNRCLHDQMFVFQESDLPRILSVVITNMQPQRSPSQKPVPANMIFLSARYAHYHANRELLNKLLKIALERMADVIELHQWDMTILAFWMSNATLLLHYLKKDAGLLEVTTSIQAQLSELINEIFILVVRDAERRLDKVLDAAMLEHETIPGFATVTFKDEWKLFKRKKEVAEQPLEKRFRPPSPKRRAKPAPRNVTSLLSSTLFVLDLYDIHSYITSQIISQLLYWLGAELFNRIMNNRKYLARTKALQIRMNVLSLEEWATQNNRKPEHYERGEISATGETTIDAAKKHLAPVIQLLQWLQVFSGLESDDLESLVGTLQSLKRLTPQQLLFAVKNYRPEVGEPGLPKSAQKYLKDLEREVATRRDRRRTASPMPDGTAPASTKKSEGNNSTAPPATEESSGQNTLLGGGGGGADAAMADQDDDLPAGINYDPAIMLPFSLPSVTDMLISYGAGFGGVNRERERKYIPTIPPEFLEKLEAAGGNSSHKPMFQEKDWENEEV
ncbi:DIL domain-containing protein [Microdochium nivale]|nr:DIL domain-containing protein [Microdochium nivale]